MADNQDEVAQRVREDQIRNEMRGGPQPQMRPSHPSWTATREPAAYKKPFSEKPASRAIVTAGLLAAAEKRGWPVIRIGDLGGVWARNRWANTRLSDEASWREFAGVIDQSLVRHLETLVNNDPQHFGHPSKPPTAPAKPHRRKSAQDEDERFLEALQGDV